MIVRKGPRAIRVLATALLAMAFAGVALAQHVPPATRTISFNIPSQPIGAALTELGQQSGLTIILGAQVPAATTAPAIVGRYTPQEALGKLLAHTGLKAEYLDARTVAIRQSLRGAGASSESESRVRNPHPRDDQKAPRSFSGPFHLGQANGGSAAGNASLMSARAPGASPGYLQEVVVTAQKREQRLLDVPVPVTAISGETLLDSNELRLEDYYTRVPGLNITTDDFGTPLVTIRGLTTGAYTNPTVGFVVDDVPYGSSSALANGQQVPDIDPSDIARIEVLRGPQGTLYGASTLGGLIKYVTIDPSTDILSGHVQAGLDAVHAGAQAGYNLRSSVNVPLSHTVAVRVSGFMRRDPGYIDNIQTGQRDVNSAKVYGGRLSALWRPSESLSLKLSGLLQDDRLNGSSYVHLPINGYAGPPLGDLQQNDLRDTGWLHHSIRAFSANLRAKLAGVEIASITGYNVNTISDSFDGTPFYAGLAQPVFGVTGSPVVTYNRTYKLTQELRLSGSIGQGLEWLLGGFYDHEGSPGSQDIEASDPATGSVAGVGLHYHNPTTFMEYAGFADLTFHFGRRFDLQLGGRESENRQSLTETTSGPYVISLYGIPGPVFYPRVSSRDHSFTYLVTPKFRISSDFMIYARLASGYRPGGPNAGVGGSVPKSFDPDKTQNYEIGAKGELLEHALSVDASLYRIDWKDIQLFLVDPITGVAYNANGSRAKSQGAELSIDARPLRQLTMTAWLAWNDAKLTEPLPPTSTVAGAAGDRLPYSSRISGSISIDDTFSVTESISGFAGATVAYIGERQGIFTSMPPRQTFPAYARTDLRAGVDYESWKLSLFVDNVADRRGILNGGVGTFIPYAFEYIQPRTVGLSLMESF